MSEYGHREEILTPEILDTVFSDLDEVARILAETEDRGAQQDAKIEEEFRRQHNHLYKPFMENDDN